MKGEGIMETKLLGYYGEQAALAYIRHQTDYRIRCCNYRNRMGEIDIIADHGRTLVLSKSRREDPSVTAGLVKPSNGGSGRKSRPLPQVI